MLQSNAYTEFNQYSSNKEYLNDSSSSLNRKRETENETWGEKERDPKK